MPIFHYAATTSTPLVTLNDKTGVMEMSGESFPENTYEFFKPIMEWIENQLNTTSICLRFQVNLSYLNTSSTKCMVDILDRLQEAYNTGREIIVNWYYDEENDRALETAEEFKEDFTFPFNIIPLPAQA